MLPELGLACATLHGATIAFNTARFTCPPYSTSTASVIGTGLGVNKQAITMSMVYVVNAAKDMDAQQQEAQASNKQKRRKQR